MSLLDYIKELFKNNKRNAKIITKDFSKTFGEKDQLEVGLYEGKTPLSDKEVIIILNGVIYKRTTDADGIARLNINLNVGVYEAKIEFVDDEFNYTNSYSKVTINPLLATYDLNMREKDGSQFKAVATSIDGVTLPNVPVLFTVNTVNYERITNENGLATLNINLEPGNYEIITQCYDVVKNNKIHIDREPPKPTRIEGTDVTKTFGEDTPYQCAVYDDIGRIAGTVKITINGVTYTKTPDTTGLYKLNINLQPGSYILRAEFQGNYKYAASSVENKIIIKEKPQPQPKSYSERLLEYFESKFGKVSCIDDCLEKVNNLGYAYYYDDKYDNYTSIDRMAKGYGVNCTDACHVFWHLGKALGYDVRCMHIGCLGGDGHVRLQFNKGKGWFNRDPAAVLSNNGYSVSYCWCLDGYLWAVNPSWFLENLNR